MVCKLFYLNRKKQIGHATSHINEPMTSKRLYVVNEIVSTEETYVKILNTVIELYVTPLENNNIITPEDMKVLFCNIKEILEGAEVLAQKLRERLKEFEVVDTICDVFLMNKSIFERYGTYIQNYEKASTLFDKLQKKKRFEEFCDQQKENPLSNNADLLSFLINPVQRIPRYILLMREYIKNTEKGHPDAAYAEQVSRYLDSYAKEVNSIIARENNKQKLRDIVKKFTDLDPLVKDQIISIPHNLLREGPLKKQCRKAIKERYFYLFDDAMIVYGEQQGKKIVFHQQIELSSVKDVEDTEFSKNGFQFKAPQKSVVVYASTLDEKKAWVMDVNYSLVGEKVYEFEEEMSDDETAPVWVPDDNVMDCMNCHNRFTLLNRRHHCRNCGRVLCADCTKKKVIIPHLSNKPQRVCDKCANEFDQKVTVLEEDSSEKASETDNPPDVPTYPPPQRKEYIKMAPYNIPPPTREPPALPSQ